MSAILQIGMLSAECAIIFTSVQLSRAVGRMDRQRQLFDKFCRKTSLKVKPSQSKTISREKGEKNCSNFEE